MTMYRPRICYANYITESDITVSTNSDTKLRLIDRNPERRWISTSGDETGTLTFTVTDEIDTICFLNTNALTFTIKYDTSSDFTPALSQAVVAGASINIVDSDNNYLVDGSTNYIVSAGIATVVYNNFYFKFTPVTPSTNVQIVVTATTDSNALRAGQVFIGKQMHEITAGGSMVVIPGTMQHLKELSDGTTNKVYVRKIVGYDLTLQNATPQERANLEIVYDINKREALYFIARPSMGDDVFDGLCGHVEWINTFDFNNYFNDIQNNGFTGVMKLRKASGIK